MKKATFPILLGMCVLLSLACSALSPAGNSVGRTETTNPRAGQAALDSGGGGGNPAGNGGAGTDGEGEEEWGLDLSSPDESVPYGIYVGATVKGDCGPYTNSGGIERLMFDAEFHGVVFSRPTETGLPGPMGGLHSANSPLVVGFAGVSIFGKGKLGDFTLCPMYETEEDSYPSRVTNGPNPFEPSISLVAMDPDVFPNVPLVGTPGPLGGGTSIILFSLGSTADMGPILAWDGKIGTNSLGGAGGSPQAPFPVTWDQLMLGQEFTVDVITGDEGETWNWTMRFMPNY
jgi:hypothetical protein